jgi:signal transduction histidine kinase
MNTLASRLHVRLQIAAFAANAAAFIALALLAPGVLLLEPQMATAALVESAWTYPIVLGLAAVVTAVQIRALGPELRVLDLESVPSADEALVQRLQGLPLLWTLRLAVLAIGVAALTMIPLLRPSLIDADTQAAIVLLTATVTAATSLPLYVVARALVGHAVEAIPWRVTERAIREPDDELTRRRFGRSDPSGRVRGRLLYAVALPVALVAFGAALIAHAHVRALEARHRRDDAYALARGVLEIESNVGSRGRERAIEAAKAIGFDVDVMKEPPEDADENGSFGEGGMRVFRAQLEDGTAIVRYDPNAGDAGGSIGGYAIAAAVAIFIAAIVGRTFGRAVSRDLQSATREVRLLGTQDVLRGMTRVAGPARFEAVAELGGGIEEVAERFREFARGRQRAIDARESAQRMRDLFLASMSHDLRGPLNSILGFVTLLLKGSEENPAHLSTGQRESLAIIDRRGRELLELIENILDAAKIEANKLELARDWSSPNDLLQQLVRRARELSDEKSSQGGASVEVVGELQPGIPPMWIDGPRFLQALVNVVANAVKFCDRGTVRVRLSHGRMPSPADTASASAVSGRPGLRVDVEDQGKGIPEKDLAQIFDAFRSPIRSRRHGGLGLGLSMTRAIVELHGGTIDVSSTPESGSAFTLWIPLPSPASVERSSVTHLRSLIRMPTPVPGSRAPEIELGARGVPAGDGPKKKKDPDSTHELPTLQMPALDIPTAPDVDYRSSGRMPVVEPPPPSPEDDADFDVRETVRLEPKQR